MRQFNISRVESSFTKWMTRHPDVIAKLREEKLAGEEGEEEITESMYDRETFKKFRSVAEWYVYMTVERPVKDVDGGINEFINVCKGVRPHINADTQKSMVGKRAGQPSIDLKNHGWVLKHPDRFTYDDFREYQKLMALHYPKVDTSGARLVVRPFLLVKGDKRGIRISGQKSKTAGTLSSLYLPLDKIVEIFDYLKSVCYEAYVLTFFMYMTATRITATLNTRLEDIKELNGNYTITVYDKGSLTKYGERGKPKLKPLYPELIEEIKLITGYPDERKRGPIFSLNKKEITGYNKRALKKFYPELWEDFPEFKTYNHFWRHMFAQHMLRATGWSYAVVANLGGWDVKSLEESYGKAPEEQIREWGISMLPKIMGKKK